MIPSIEAVRKVLDKLVTSKYPKIIDYEVQMDMDENSSLITSVEVFFEPEGYWNTYNNGDYDYTGEFEADIEEWRKEVKSGRKRMKKVKQPI
jgi:hypothetical protein